MRPIPAEQLDAAARALEAGELVVVPTERWYMICADATNPIACNSIFDGKQRPRTKSLVLVLPSMEECEKQFVVHPEARQLADAFWPGNLAMLLPWRSTEIGEHHPAVGSPALTTLSSGPLGALAAAVRTLVAATTVNISGDAGTDAPGPAITAKEVRGFLEFTGVRVTVLLDGGVSPAAHHLTIVDCSAPAARLVRPGLVHERALAAVLGHQVL
ncbi:Sua5/YciO/YrdC/YwlC family protein [Kitasatospora sp. YST-16]|uniref:L-threonylcarbamoyladenylate synthase n=1 Tax=Kitasatospora sp. YST-16 TaxID=2998080 RepID=UPI0022851A14|nr:Sua5/YciO/YrdC/YwlC family protein [Kitasatospora sp. YST-16]WAL75108.1 Sua5/YciO/YrdC/YwlC family protein [Kitasatospora sp. YST-16]WNW41166.1 Sua5/YciO/YrdC/YwlC family protein [Streptomyces sp. Li-HN-5-13]